MILDYEFTRLYKLLEGSITRALTTRNTNEQSKPVVDQSAILLAQYNEVIQQQNQQLFAYQQQEKQLTDERVFYQQKLGELEQMLKESQEQNAILKASPQQSQHSNGDDSQLRTLCEQQQAELEYLRNMVVRIHSIFAS